MLFTSATNIESGLVMSQTNVVHFIDFFLSFLSNDKTYLTLQNVLKTVRKLLIVEIQEFSLKSFVLW